MKKYLILLVCIFITSFCSAQVGVNTEPEKDKILHIKNTAKDKNLMVVDSITGNVGIGKTNPSEKLDVSGNTRVNGDMYVGKNLIIRDKASIGESVSFKSGVPSSNLEIITDGSLPAVRVEPSSFSDNKYLISDAYGNATWALLRTDSKIVGYGNKLYDSQKTIAASTTNYTDITDNPLKLSKGRWLILAKYNTQRVTSNNFSSMIYTKLISYPDGSPSESRDETEFGVQPEQKSGSLSFALPQLFHVVHITEDRVFKIVARARNNPVRTFESTFVTNSFFCAIRLSDY